MLYMTEINNTYNDEIFLTLIPSSLQYYFHCFSVCCYFCFSEYLVK